MTNLNSDSDASKDDSWFVPNFSEGFKGTRMQQGYDAEFRAVASGKPKPKVSWTKNGNIDLSSSPEKFILSYDQDSGKISLVIRNLGPGDEGTYSCTVSNPYGKTTATLSVNPDGNNQSASNCFGPGSSRGTLQRQHVLKKMQMQGQQNGNHNHHPESQISPEIKGL